MKAQAAQAMMVRSGHSALYLTAIRSTASGRHGQVVQLIDTIFGLLPAVYGEPDRRRIYPESAGDRILSESDISKLFYLNFFCPVILRRDFSGNALSADEFLSEVTQFEATHARNRLFFLQGGVGAGKTALINQIITKHGQDLFVDKGVWFVRLNIDVLRHSEQSNLAAFFEALCNKLETIIKKVWERNAEDLGEHVAEADLVEVLGVLQSRPAFGSTAVALELREIARKAILLLSKKLKRRPLLILDNMDFLVHQRDRFSFLCDREELSSRQLTTIRNIVGSFYLPDSMLSDVGANVIFVLRPDTYHMIKTSQLLVPMGRAPFVDNRSLYTLQSPAWEQVVEERAGLLEKCIRRIEPEGLREELLSHSGPLINRLRHAGKRERLLMHLREISVFGLRGVLSFLSDYTWYPASSQDTEAQVTTRFFETYQLGLIAFMLNNRRLYSQNEAHFPNIFYSAVLRDEEGEWIETPAIGSGERRTIRGDHWHTYWLKRLLLEFIRTRNSNGEAVRTEDIIEVFCRLDGEQSFSEDLVRLCLGSFSQSHVSDLIVSEREVTGDQGAVRVQDIKLTPRAVHSLDNIFDRFPYLQLVVDDHLLPVPRVWRAEFQIDPTLTYDYLTAPPQEFSSKARQMILAKSEKVVRFLALLSEALEAEKATKPLLFEWLKAEGVKIRTPEAILEDVLLEFEALSVANRASFGTWRGRFSKWKKDVRLPIRAACGAL